MTELGLILVQSAGITCPSEMNSFGVASNIVNTVYSLARMSAVERIKTSINLAANN
jgi:hypothetical protein